jgi:hypothetical protein
VWVGRGGGSDRWVEMESTMLMIERFVCLGFDIRGERKQNVNLCAKWFLNCRLRT